ncbi:hypothetical protein R1sor_027454 [Riccia sorocarpa]|uniref:ACB domain-containing protein n=1 Tax=Riccia sorocarpa TaxID=122646 RepID=A0ABD3GFY2_9MARC
MGIQEEVIETARDIGHIEKEWRAAQLFMAKGPSATLEFLVDDAKAELYAYRAQALDGPCPHEQDGSLTIDPALRKKQEAWASLGDMSKDTAKQKFIQFLTTVLPEWKEWSDTQGEALRKAQSEGTAERILREFRVGKSRLSPNSGLRFGNLVQRK